MSPKERAELKELFDDWCATQPNRPLDGSDPMLSLRTLLEKLHLHAVVPCSRALGGVVEAAVAAAAAALSAGGGEVVTQAAVNAAQHAAREVPGSGGRVSQALPIAPQLLALPVGQNPAMGMIDFTTFAGYYQVCSRCTLSQRKKVAKALQQSSMPANIGLDGGKLSMKQALALAAQSVPKVVVRRCPVDFEGAWVRCCNHFQWVWCPGIKGNPKCRVRILCSISFPCVLLFVLALVLTLVRVFLVFAIAPFVKFVRAWQGSNRHTSCPKYLAKSTSWKHLKPLATGDGSVPESTAGAAATLAAASAAAKASGHTSQFGSTPWTGTLESISATVAASASEASADQASSGAPGSAALASAAASLGLSLPD